MDPIYLSCAQTARLVRAALKREFPAVKFSIRSETYSGGASITVRWAEGPTSAEVESVAKPFAAGRFDGTIDLHVSVRSWLMPDGSTCVASDPGTIGSGGVLPPTREWMPSPEATLVRFGADFIFCDREATP